MRNNPDNNVWPIDIILNPVPIIINPPIIVPRTP
jgi:hypothetical protein